MADCELMFLSRALSKTCKARKAPAIGPHKSELFIASSSALLTNFMCK